ncbi:MAG: winged helix-turn-helix transcriptional regulator [Methanobrevibacter sp.]|nr:winged helix-turn-helix transcriptional regulator [Methanobrevibacter sp.]
MEILQKRGALTHFQILGEISKQEPNLKQKDLAERLGITIQAVSENIKTLTELGYITSKDGRAPYKITQKGINKVKKDAITLRKYSDSVLETMTYYKSTWPAIAKEDLKEGDEVGLYMEDGRLYASINVQSTAYADVILDTKKGFDVALTNLKGLIEIKDSKILIISLPPIKDGGSRSADLDLIKDIYEGKYENYGLSSIDKVAAIGTTSHAIANNLGIPIDIEFGVSEAAQSAVRKGLNVMILSIGDMSKNISKDFEDANIQHQIIDARKPIKTI